VNFKIHGATIQIKKNILTDFRKNLQTSNFMKIIPVEAELFNANARP
jgi:hypothetical protein